MKKLEKYKIAPQAKFVKFKVKHFVEIQTIRHDKAVPPSAWLPKIIFPPLNVSPPWLLKFSSCPSPLPGWWHKNHSPPDPKGGGHYVNLNWAYLWINSLNFYMAICGLSKYTATKLQATCFHLTLSFFKK